MVGATIQREVTMTMTMTMTAASRSVQLRWRYGKAEQLALKGQLFAKKILRMFDEVDFLVGASADPRSCLAVLHYRDDCITPHLYVLVDGVRAEVSAGAPDAG